MSVPSVTVGREQRMLPVIRVDMDEGMDGLLSEWDVQGLHLAAGLVPAFHRFKDVVKRVVKGGSVKEQGLLRKLLADLKDAQSNMEKYAKNGMVEAKLDILRKRINEYQTEYHRMHGGGGVSDDGSATAPEYDGNHMAAVCQWVLIPR